MALTTDQKAFFEEYGYLPYTQVLSDEEVEALRQRSEDIIEGACRPRPIALHPA